MKLNINDEQGIEFLHYIFEREFKPPFRKGEMDDRHGDYPYYNRNDECIGWYRDNEHTGWLLPADNFTIKNNPFLYSIKYKVCSAFEYDVDGGSWWKAIKPRLKSWLEDQLNNRLKNISL